MIGNDQQLKGTSNKYMGLFRHTTGYGRREKQCHPMSGRAPSSVDKQLDNPLLVLRAHQFASNPVEVVWRPVIGRPLDQVTQNVCVQAFAARP